MFSRNELFWGKDFQKELQNKHVIVFGIGAVGGYSLECLARVGIGKFTIVDFDCVDKSNINRQIIATHSNIGEKKTALFEKRLKEINPDITLRVFETFYDESTSEEIFKDGADAVIDAIDTMKSKIALLKYSVNNGYFTVSAMGAGNKLNPTKLMIKEISEIQKTKCNFAQNIIRILRKEGIQKGIKAVFSEEEIKPKERIEKKETVINHLGESISFNKITPASISFVTATAGCYCAYAVIDYFLSKKQGLL